MSSSISKALQHLGFEPERAPGAGGDFRLEDHGDGKGVHLVWLSKDKPQPMRAAIEAARAVAPTEPHRS